MKKADHEQLVGRTIAGKFVVEGLIGTGAMGAVFRARQIALEKTVAIKVLHGEHARDPAFAARFQREAKTASRLNHPNSMQVLDYGAEPDGLLYIAMEFLDGRSLHTVMRDEWPLPAPRIADIVMQTLAALAVAHDMGVVHRDLKPENIMILSGTDDDGQPRDVVKVCDFGIAKIADPRAYRTAGERESDGPVTTAGFLVGTPEYMSPEQGRGEKLDFRSDLYSVGVILFELLTKRVPFDAENAIGIVLKHITEEPPRPSSLVPGVDPRLEAVIARALKKFREERYPNAREMRADLRAVVEGRGSMVASDPGPSLPVLETAVLVNAATVQMPALSASPSNPPVSVISKDLVDLTRAGAADAPVKPTLQGTTAAVSGPPPRRRSVVLAVVAAAALAVGSITTVAVVRGRAHASPTATSSTVAASPDRAAGTAATPGTATPSGPTKAKTPGGEAERPEPTHAKVGVTTTPAAPAPHAGAALAAPLASSQAKTIGGPASKSTTGKPSASAAGSASSSPSAAASAAVVPAASVSSPAATPASASAAPPDPTNAPAAVPTPPATPPPADTPSATPPSPTPPL